MNTYEGVKMEERVKKVMDNNDVGIIDLEKRMNKLEHEVGQQEQESLLNVKARLEELEKCTERKDPFSASTNPLTYKGYQSTPVKHKYYLDVEAAVKFMDCPIGSFIWINAIDGKTGLGFKTINSYSAYEGGTALVYNLLHDDLVYPVTMIEEKIEKDEPLKMVEETFNLMGTDGMSAAGSSAQVGQGMVNITLKEPYLTLSEEQCSILKNLFVQDHIGETIRNTSPKEFLTLVAFHHGKID